MNIIEVIPVSRGIGTDSLSYFTSQKIPVGAIVTIPLRKKMVSGVVISVRAAEDMKSEIKNAHFALKKIEKIKSVAFFSEAFMQTVRETADYYATSVGSVLTVLVPEYILKNVGALKISKSKKSEEKEGAKKEIEKNEGVKSIHEKYVVQGADEDRCGTWKSLIRQEFAHKKSVLFLVPTIEDATRMFGLIEKGIEGYAFMLHGGVPTKKIIETWNTLTKETHPIVLVTTGGFLSIPRADIETIIVEKESNKTYKIQRRPFLDIRHVAETLARIRKIKLYYGDSFLRVETLWREAQGELVQASPFKLRALSTAHDKLVDMRATKEFKILSREVIDLIAQTKENSGHMIILATRRGLSPSTICGDCQTIVTCKKCSAPIVLHVSGEKRFFMCHRCGDRRSAEEYCVVCGSWKLTTIGIGIDMVKEKIEEAFPDSTLFQIDSDATPTEKGARETVQKFRAQPGSILIGTEMMLQYLHDPVDTSAIISLDSLFSIPDFRIQEKILHILISMRSLTAKQFLVQTRKADEKVFEYGLKGNMSDFYRQEVEERKKFNYPPFSTLIKITIEGARDSISKEMEEVQNSLEPYEVEVFPAFTQTVRGKHVLHGLLRIPQGKWPAPDLIEKIRSLSPSVSVKVDPDTLL